MAIQLGKQSINNLSIFELDEDPRISGFTANVGSIAMIDAVLSDVYFKYGLGNSQWQAFVKQSFFKATNTEIGQNLNSSNSASFITTVNIFGNIEESGIGDFTQIGESLQCNFQGFLKIVTTLHIFSTELRVSTQIRLKKNDNLIGGVSSTGYIRDISGHQESSLSITTIIPVVQNDVITLNSRREAAQGTVELAQVGTSEILFERY